jgi:hypothetical protein
MPVLGILASNKSTARTIVIGLSLPDILQMLKGDILRGNLEALTGVAGLKLLLLTGDSDDKIRETMATWVNKSTVLDSDTATNQDIENFISDKNEKPS